MTCTSVNAAVNNGWARAKHSTNTQYPGLSAAAEVMSSPSTSVRRRTVVRPHRSASDASGSAPSEATRKIASPRPSTEPESPTTLANDPFVDAWPKWSATSFNEVVAPNCAKLATSATEKRMTVTRSGRRGDELGVTRTDESRPRRGLSSQIFALKLPLGPHPLL